MLLRILLIGCISFLLGWTGAMQKSLSVEDICDNNKVQTSSISGFNIPENGVQHFRVPKEYIQLKDVASGKKMHILFDNDSVIFHSDSRDDLPNHGMAEDNDHLDIAVEMPSALIKSNKQFESYYYPDTNRSIYPGITRLPLITKMTDLVLKNI